jgi:hypothetical protein
MASTARAASCGSSGPSLDALAQRLALDEVHGQVALSLGATDVVHGDDARVLQAGRGARLDEEALDLLGIRRAHDLERDPPAQPLVLGDVHDPHAAARELALDAVRAEPRRRGAGERQRRRAVGQLLRRVVRAGSDARFGDAHA